MCPFRFVLVYRRIVVATVVSYKNSSPRPKESRSLHFVGMRGTIIIPVFILGVLLLLWNVLYTFPIVQSAKHKLYRFDSDVNESIMVSGADENRVGARKPSVILPAVEQNGLSTVQGVPSAQQSMAIQTASTNAGTPPVKLNDAAGGLQQTQNTASGTVAPTRNPKDWT